jgi:hypothetical protein
LTFLYIEGFMPRVLKVCINTYSSQQVASKVSLSIEDSLTTTRADLSRKHPGSCLEARPCLWQRL